MYGLLFYMPAASSQQQVSNIRIRNSQNILQYQTVLYGISRKPFDKYSNVPCPLLPNRQLLLCYSFQQDFGHNIHRRN
jgi:hypothetical protein